MIGYVFPFSRPGGSGSDVCLALSSGPRGLTDHGRRWSVPLAYALNSIPCASGNCADQLMVLVWRRMQAFHASLPLSRPPPVSFSPPNAPPISAPLVPMLTLAD